MLALRSACIHPATNEPYVKSIVGGKDNSPEGLQVNLLLSLGFNYHRRAKVFLVEWNNTCLYCRIRKRRSPQVLP